MRNKIKHLAKPIKLFIGVLFTLALVPAKAQTTDTLVYTKVMLIPFEERMYFSDSDKKISEQSKMSHERVRRSFRASLMETLSRDAQKVYGGVYEVDGDKVEDKTSDIAKLYRSVVFKPEKRKPKPEDKPANEVAVEKLNNLIKKKDSPSEDPMKYSGITGMLDKNGFYDYMNIAVTDTSTLKQMQRDHGTDLFLFINQFEIKTNYRTCIDAATGLYERNFAVHYSVFNSDGQQLAGDMLVFPYHSNESRIKMMVYHMFGKISAAIIATMPTPYKIGQEKTVEEEDTEDNTDEEEDDGIMPAHIGDMIRRD